MRRVVFALSLALVLLAGIAFSSKVAPSAEPQTAFAQAGATYVGSEVCAACHRAIYDSFKSTGHPYKLRTAAEAKAAGLPKPSYVEWGDILFVIGGFKWKARYIDQNGYIITQSKDGSIKGKNQFNIETEQFVDYEPGKAKPYDCGSCHTTGYSKEGNQLGKPGLIGTWALNGIQCEACHGPGSEHAWSGGDKTKIKIDRSAATCGTCHSRGTNMAVIPAKPPFIEHHEQYQEMLQSPHKKLDCVTCHNPHKRARLDMNATCASCHFTQVADFQDSKHQKAGVRCESCHMPNLVKTAVQRGPFEADIPAHLFTINTDTKAKQFTDDGKFANGYVTWQYACLPCHSGRDEAWAAQNMKGVHKLGK